VSLLDAVATYLRPPDSRPMKEIDREICDELQFHVETRIEENVRAGMSPEAARADARRRFGDFRRIYRSCRRIQLGERMMLQRIQVALTAVLLVVVVGMAVGFYKRQAQYDAALTGLRQSMDEMRAGLDRTIGEMQTGLSEVLDGAQPVVVGTQPGRGDTNVDPSLTEIRVTFNKRMMDGSWSWCQTEDQPYPDVTGSPYYLEDGKTCVLPARLEPETEYVIWINSEGYRNFKDEHGQRAVPYALYFTTRSES
jgi:RNA polymerase sigma-70 factor (ECF subfamily)